MSVKHTEVDNLPGGLLAVNKPVGISSHDVVNRIRKLYNTKRVGHAGTLDPMAEGVLVVLVGRAAKACEYISSDRKTYTATLRLGIETDTEDITGLVTRKHEGELPSFEQVKNVCERFKSRIMQTPPMYSALKVGGKKLYDLARQGVVIERRAREIEISDISCKETEKKEDVILTVTCSGGTYIRTLCADIGGALGCGGVMASLRRDEACGLHLSQAHTLEEIEALTQEQRTALLLDVEGLFCDLPKVRLSPFFEKLFRDGCPIYQKKIKTDFKPCQRIRICSQNGEFFALGEVGEYEDGSAVRSIKIFKL